MATKQRRNKNGQIEYYDDKTGKAVTSGGTTGTVTTSFDFGKDKQKEVEKKAVVSQLNDTSEDAYYRDVYGMSKLDYDNLVMSSGSGSEPPAPKKNISYKDWVADKKGKASILSYPGAGSKGKTETKQETKTDSVDGKDEKFDSLTKKQNKTLKTAAKTAKDERPVNLNEEARKLVQELKKGYYDVDDKYLEGIPMGIIEAYKQGRFGNPDSENAKAAKNYLIADSFLNAISNVGRTLNGKDKENSMWKENVKKNFNEGNDRRNEKFATQMKNEMGLVNDGSKMSLQLDNDINKMFQDNVIGLAAKRANNLEDQMGMLYVYQMAGEAWNHMTPEEKWGLIGAQQAIRNGDSAGAQSYLNIFDMDKLAKYGLTQAKLNNDLLNANIGNIGIQSALIGKQVDWFDFNQGMNALNNTLSATGDVIGGFIPG